MKEDGNNESGFALLSVLVILAILTPLVVNLSYESRVQMAGAAFFAEKIKSRQIAKSGLETAMIALRDDENDYDSYSEEWGDFKDLSSLSRSFFSNGYFSGYIEDEEGKIKLNSITAGPTVRSQLERLFELYAYDEDTIDAIVDWIDDDDEPELMGAENDYYNSRENPYSAKNRAMENIYELRLVKSADKLFVSDGEKEAIYLFLSVYGDNKININTAPFEVLLSLSEDMDVDIASAIIERREEKPFKKAEEVGDMAEVDGALFGKISESIKVKSDYFSVSIKAYSGEVSTEIRAILMRKGGKVEVLSYYEV
jgi:general secretion pathway protein K